MNICLFIKHLEQNVGLSPAFQPYHAADKWETFFPFYPAPPRNLSPGTLAVSPNLLEWCGICRLRLIRAPTRTRDGSSFPSFPHWSRRGLVYSKTRSCLRSSCNIDHVCTGRSFSHILESSAPMGDSVQLAPLVVRKQSGV